MLSREKILESLLDLSGRAAARSRPELLATVLRCALALCESDGSVVMLSPGRQPERFAMRRDQPEPEGPIAPEARGTSRPMMLYGKAVVLADVNEGGRTGPDDHCPGLDAGPALFVPLKLRDQSPGYLAVLRKRGAAKYDGEDVRLLTLLGAWASMALENLRLAQNVEKLAVTDDLTQVYNYRFLKSALRREIKRAGRYHQDLALLMIDVDNLKAYNDRHGHLRGSFLLREMAGLFARHVRSWDLVAKYGGDEFTVILPQTDADGATSAAERLRAGVEGHTFPLAHPGQITVSIGIAAFPENGQTTSALIESADRALYLAKQNGRNQVGPYVRRAA
ncbi:MAG: sensor domain-containing diguanylate cyclase [Candidatus Eisenbacteria bacterium]|uniref:Sensor domain-containing diguanylate cyclase n=1 Tax=Eiseniibacteriota bacterium TaxID=2212470 RepID=A0A9D6L8R1_UNCEI|nr:sensor domain-containing diguanylate cyclase [Candidatus Eisenbacteria bacterium]MBI3539944.1 sensor domain-containing diguanylate cyclase [Candidatus Eisenbacteria bacterium]